MSNARETLQRAIDSLGLTLESTFVPWSKSRNASDTRDVTKRTLNWHVTLKRNGREILATDYSAGIAHAPSYKQGARMSLDGEAALIHETEKGTIAKPSAMLGHVYSGKPVAPDTCDVIAALVSDASALDHATFEQWASDLGYDSDSRSAEATYRACLAIGLALRAGIGDSGLATLQVACSDY